ncbi:MAG: AMP-binding protein, partial [Rhodocyclales bacterium]|nr:AMP-binding protein [Rhodocyclales bacterium]
MYPTDSAAQVEYLLHDSGAVYVFVENDEQLDKVLSVRDRLPRLRRIVVFDTEHLSEFSDPMVMDLNMLCRLGKAAHERMPKAWIQRAQETRATDIAIVVYTSGTTGKPKGAMLTNRNVLFAMDVLANHVLQQHQGDERMGYLPLCHVAERIGGLMAALLSGTIINFVENPDAVAENIREIQPTMIFGVPRTWEKFYSAIQIRLSEATPFQRQAYGWAIALGARMSALRLRHTAAPWWLRAVHGLMSLTVLRNIRTAIGLQRCRVLCSAAAPISVRLLEWYSALGIEVIEVYGQTECTGILTANPLGSAKLGTVGVAVPGCELRLSAEGEILARGPNVFAGYLNQPEATLSALADGWLHTGDVGEIDADGYLRIKDRLKDIIIT